MLSLLLDENISPLIVQQLRRKYPGIPVQSIYNWREGKFIGAPDSLFMSEAARDGLTLVSYDLRTIPPLLKTWMEQGVDHGGVVFVDAKTIASHDFGGLVRAIGSLWRSERRGNWTNRTLFLRRERA